MCGRWSARGAAKSRHTHGGSKLESRAASSMEETHPASSMPFCFIATATDRTSASVQISGCGPHVPSVHHVVHPIGGRLLWAEGWPLADADAGAPDAARASASSAAAFRAGIVGGSVWRHGCLLNYCG